MTSASWSEFEGDLARKYLRTIGRFGPADMRGMGDKEALELARGLRPPFPGRSDWPKIFTWLRKLDGRGAVSFRTSVPLKPDGALRQANNVGVVDLYGTGMPGDNKWAINRLGKVALSIRGPGRPNPRRRKPPKLKRPRKLRSLSSLTRI